MTDLDNIRVIELYNLSDEKFKEYLSLQQIMKSKDIFCDKKAKQIQGLEFGQVSEIKSVLQNPTFDGIKDIFRIIFDVKDKEYLNADVVSYFYAFNHINQEIQKILKKEKKALSSQNIDADMIAAGVEKLNIFGDLSDLIEIGEMFGKSPDEVSKWKYSLVFSIKFYNKTKNEIDIQYQKIKNRNVRR